MTKQTRLRQLSFDSIIWRFGRSEPEMHRPISTYFCPWCDRDVVGTWHYSLVWCYRQQTICPECLAKLEQRDGQIRVCSTCKAFNNCRFLDAMSSNI